MRPPAGLRPMHPTAARALPAAQEEWAFEPKWGGYRALGHVVGGGLRLRSRNGVDMAGWFPELDGLAGALGGREGVFDLLWLDGRLLTGLPGRLRFAGRIDHGLVPAARRRVRELLGPLVTAERPFAEPRRPCSGTAGPGPVPTTRPRCSSDPRSPSRSASSAGSRAASATLPTPA